MAHLPPSAQTQVATPDLTTGTTLVKETSQHLEEEIAAKPAVLEETSGVPSGHGASEASAAAPDVEPLTSTTDNDDIIVIESIDQRTDFEMDPAPPLRSPKSSKKNSPRTSKGRSSKVKPKPNLGQASRAAQSQLPPGTLTVGRAEKIHPEAPDLAQTTETLPAAEETPKKPDCSEDVLKEDISCIEVQRAEVPSGSQRSAGEVQSATPDQIASEKQRHCFSEAEVEPGVELAFGDSRSTSGSTEEVLTAERSCNDQVTSDTAVTESQGSSMDSAPAQESGDHLAPCVAPEEESPVNQKEEREVEAAQPTRKSRFQKVKPKLNLAQTSRTIRSKPQTTKDTVEKDSHSTPNPTIHEKTIAEVEAEPTKSPKIQSCPDPTSDLIPLVNLGTTLTPTEELSTAEEKKTDVGVGRVDSDAATSHQSVSEEQNIPEEQFTPRREEAPRDTTPTLESLDEKLTSHCGAAESCNDPQLTSDSVVTESQTGRGSNVDSVQEIGDHPATHAEELPVSQKEGNDGVSTSVQSPRRRLQKVKPKPNLPQTSRTARSKPRTSKDSVDLQHAETPPSQTSGSESTDDTRAVAEAPPTCSAPPPERTIQIKGTSTSSTSTSTSSTSTSNASGSEPPGELCFAHKTTEETSSCEEQKTDVGLDSNSKGSEQNVPQRRQRFSKVKPNLGSSPRTARAKLQANAISKPPDPGHVDTSLSSEPHPVDNSAARTEQDITVIDLSSTLYSTRTEPSSLTKPVPAASAQDGTQSEGSSPPCLTIATYWGAENWSQHTDLVLENISGENLPVKEGECLGANTANSDHVEAGLASQCGRDRDMSVRATESNSSDPIAALDVRSSEGVSTRSAAESILITSTRSTAGSKESTRQPPAEDECEAQSPDAAQQCSDTDPTAAQSSDGNPSEPTDSPSRKAPQARRGRLVKPKPRLVPSSRPPQPRQVQNAKQAETDVGACSVGVDAELRPDISDPTEGAIVQCRSQSSSPNDAESSVGCVTQVPDSCPRDASPSNVGGTQSLLIFPDTLSQQELSDSDETFFILSLTEIPVGSLSDSVDSVPEPLPCLPVTDASIEQRSVPVPASVEESGEPAACTTQQGLMVEDLVEPLVHPSKLETPENTDETEPAGGPPGPRRRVKAQVKPKTTKRKQASKKEAGLPPIQTDPAELSELPGSSLQPEASVDVTEPHGGGGDGVHVGGSGAQATRARLTRSQIRKPKGFLSVISDTSDTATASDAPPGKAAPKGPAVRAPPGKAAPKGPAVRAPRAAGERSAAPAASTSRDVAPAWRATRPTDETASPTHTPAEVSASQKSDSVEEEPTSVSQYFLCDIFTDVEG